MEFLGTLAVLLSVGSSVAAQLEENAAKMLGAGPSYRTGPYRTRNRNRNSGSGGHECHRAQP